MSMIAAAPLLVFPALVTIAGLKDLTSYTIPNWISAVLAVAFFPAALVLGLYIGLQHLANSPWGRVLRAIREDESAAQALGKRPTHFRLQAFTIGGAIMGLAGAAQGHFIGFIAPDNYLPILTFQVWAMLIVGGSGNNRGAILGAVVVWGLWALSAAGVSAFVPPEQQARASSLQIVMIGVGLCLILLLRPRGILGAFNALAPLKGKRHQIFGK